MFLIVKMPEIEQPDSPDSPGFAENVCWLHIGESTFKKVSDGIVYHI